MPKILRQSFWMEIRSLGEWLTSFGCPPGWNIVALGNVEDLPWRTLRLEHHSLGLLVPTHVATLLEKAL